MKNSPRPQKIVSNKATGFAKEYAGIRKNKTVLIGDIHAHVLKKSGLPEPDRRQDVIHASEMSRKNWCPRQTYYRVIGTEPTDVENGRYGRQMMSIFEEGDVTHLKWQNWLAEMGRLSGLWRCRECGHTEWGVGRVRDIHGPMDYAEVPLSVEEEYGIIGHADGAVDDLNALIEIKTIGLGSIRIELPDLVREHTARTTDGKTVSDLDAIWKGLRRPFPSHRRQAQLYLWMCNKMGLPYDRMIFLYEFKSNQDAREFVIRYDPEYIEHLIDQALDIRWAIDQSIPVPRPPEYTKEHKPCTDCVFQTLCWSSDDTRPEKQDAGYGTVVPGREEPAGSAEDLSSHPTGLRLPGTARGSDDLDRPGSDHPDGTADEMVRVFGRATGRGRGRRTVRRGSAGDDQGY